MRRGLGATASVAAAFTRHFAWTVLGLAVLPIVVFTVVVALTPATLDQANMYVDSVVKVLAIVVGAAWTLNRFFASRTDALQLRVEPQAALVPPEDKLAKDGDALLLYRIDVVNTGRVLFHDYWIEVEIASVEVDAARHSPAYYVLDEIPRHLGGPIEPGSWAAVSGAAVVDADLRAVRLAARIETESGQSWTWHQSVPVGADLTTR